MKNYSRDYTIRLQRYLFINLLSTGNQYDEGWKNSNMNNLKEVYLSRA